MASRWSVMWQWPALLVIRIHILMLNPRLLRHRITNISFKNSYVTLPRTPVLQLNLHFYSVQFSSESLGAKKVIACPNRLMYFCVQTKCKKALARITHCLDQCEHGQLKSTEELWSCESQCKDHKLHNWKQIRSPRVASHDSWCWDHYNFDRYL